METPCRLTGRTALVTGAATGIGRAIALRLAAEGADVAVADIDQAGAAATAERVAEFGRRGRGFTVDLADVASIRAMVAAVVAGLGGIDVLVNNAGINGSQRFPEVTPEEWDRVLGVNARGTYFVLQEVAVHMRERGGGRIVNLASIAAKGFRRTGSIPYAASKAAVVAMTRMAALSLARDNVTVNAICPGPTRSDVFAGIVRRHAEAEGIDLEASYRVHDDHIPIGRSNEPDDIAALAAFLASDDARNVTGQSWNVDGGLIWD
jgi:NAD(P)-dependent dehydrogenase (short-subunit alcohol dehydrogenase family)